jgi:hypothetical protein
MAEAAVAATVAAVTVHDGHISQRTWKSRDTGQKLAVDRHVFLSPESAGNAAIAADNKEGVSERGLPIDILCSVDVGATNAQTINRPTREAKKCKQDVRGKRQRYTAACKGGEDAQQNKGYRLAVKNRRGISSINRRVPSTAIAPDSGSPHPSTSPLRFHCAEQVRGTRPVADGLTEPATLARWIDPLPEYSVWWQARRNTRAG